MIDERILDLINKEIDGTIVPAERSILDEYRVKSPEVDAVEYELRNLIGDLDQVRPVEAPVSLKSRVYQAIQSEAQPQPVVSLKAAPVREFLAKFGGMRLTYAFSAGVALGAIAIALFLKSANSSDVSSEDASGVLIMGSTSSPIDQGTAVPINAPGVSGVMTAQFADKVSVLKIKINSVDPLRAHYTFDPAAMGVRAFQRGTEAACAMNVKGNTLEVQTRGNDSYTIYFDRKTVSAAPLRVTLYVADTEVFDRNVQVGKAQ